jgi:hypothetical protein
MSDYKPNHFGTLLTFRKDVPKAKIEAALKWISQICDEEPELEEYDDNHANPCFYLP